LSLAVVLLMIFPQPSWALDPSCLPTPPYEAPQYIPPPEKHRESKVHLKDNKDGTLTELVTGLMWAKNDSYAELGRCLNYTESLEYVNKLQTGGYKDWRIPTIAELATIYDETKENTGSWNHDPEYPLALDEKFGDGAAYWYWSSDCGKTELSQCCAKTLYFVNGLVRLRQYKLCNNGGVRAVRNVR
ncbi:MAG: DUF1566 domain-containing protein, partial [Nitrospinales bacterium]